MKLNGRQVAELQDALLDAFTLFSLRQMVRFELDRHLAHVAGGQNFTEIVFNLVEWAEQQERVDDLVNGAQRFNPTNRSLQIVAQHLALATPKQPQLPQFDWVTVRAGACLVGSDPARDPAARADEMPHRECDVPLFRIARTAVTNLQYEQFVDAMGYRVPHHWVDGKIPPGKAAHPVIHLSFEDGRPSAVGLACACRPKWSGKRLPAAPPVASILGAMSRQTRISPTMVAMGMPRPQ
jgi:formylglycine-generating enzyme required for sulfatase activity